MVIEADKTDISSVVDFLNRKIEWLKHRNKNQWQFGYTNAYDVKYFSDCLNNGDILLVDKEDNMILGCLLLKRNGHYIEEYTSIGTAMYILHFASMDIKSGKRLLENCVRIAKKCNIDYLRGDANKNFGYLSKYYTMFGAKIVKECTFHDGCYHCVLLEYVVK